MINLRKNSLISATLRALRYAMVKRMMDALSRALLPPGGSGSAAARAVKISVSRPRRHRAASLDFSLRLSEFLRTR
jgi:hypothetical protein